ncbi:MAG: c-type cytochrome biogenesis protein CcsB [bacterium]
MIITLEISLLFYAMAMVSYSLALLWKAKFFQRYSWWVFFTGGIFHLSSTILRMAESGRWPFLGMFESMSFMSLMFVVVYLFTERRLRSPSIGAFAAPLVFIALSIAAFHPHEAAPLAPALKSYWYPIHAAVCFFSYGFFGIAFIASLVYFIQEWLLKKKLLLGFHRIFPPLETIDTLCYRLIAIGFPMITIGIVTGAVWAQTAWGAYWNWDPKEIGSLIIWICYAVYLHFRFVGGWQGRRTNIILIIGFVFVLLTFFGVNYLPTGLHKYGAVE